jgi:hypothetical protein
VRQLVGVGAPGDHELCAREARQCPYDGVDALALDQPAHAQQPAGPGGSSLGPVRREVLDVHTARDHAHALDRRTEAGQLAHLVDGR